MAPIFIFLCLISLGLAAPNQDVGEARENGVINLSELFNSDMAGPTMLIAGVLFVDILLMVFYFGERTNKSYRYRTKKGAITIMAAIAIIAITDISIIITLA